MEEHWYGNPEVSGSSPGPVKLSLPMLQTAVTVDSSYNAPGYNAVLDIALIISGPRSNKKHEKLVPL